VGVGGPAGAQDMVWYLYPTHYILCQEKKQSYPQENKSNTTFSM